ncbi:MAG TPA: alpha/beta hydrolase, partial [Candidatus Binataceae bacterium]
MPLNPKVKAMLEEMVASKTPGLTSLPPPESRRMARTMFAQMAPSEPVGSVVDRAIPGPGGSIPIRIYRPALTQPLPILVFLHGGGFVIGDLETHDAVCRALTNRAQCVTLSVDYRLAPEHPAPAAGDDCYAATNWAYDNAKSLGVDPKRLAVGGDSAGGNLAAVVTLMGRDR